VTSINHPKLIIACEKIQFRQKNTFDVPTNLIPDINIRSLSQKNLNLNKYY